MCSASSICSSLAAAQLELTIDGQSAGDFLHRWRSRPGPVGILASAGPHQLTLRTLNFAPVRLFGWALDNKQGVTVETLGINGAQANVILNWNEQMWAAEIAAAQSLAGDPRLRHQRSQQPSLDRGAIPRRSHRHHRAHPARRPGRIHSDDRPARLRTSPASAASCRSRSTSSGETARQLNVAFWDWRLHMGGPRHHQALGDGGLGAGGLHSHDRRRLPDAWQNGFRSLEGASSIT